MNRRVAYVRVGRFGFPLEPSARPKHKAMLRHISLPIRASKGKREKE